MATTRLEEITGELDQVTRDRVHYVLRSQLGPVGARLSDALGLGEGEPLPPQQAPQQTTTAIETQNADLRAQLQQRKLESENAQLRAQLSAMQPPQQPPQS